MVESTQQRPRKSFVKLGLKITAGWAKVAEFDPAQCEPASELSTQLTADKLIGLHTEARVLSMGIVSDEVVVLRTVETETGKVSHLPVIGSLGVTEIPGRDWQVLTASFKARMWCR